MRRVLLLTGVLAAVSLLGGGGDARAQDIITNPAEFSKAGAPFMSHMIIDRWTYKPGEAEKAWAEYTRHGARCAERRNLTELPYYPESHTTVISPEVWVDQYIDEEHKDCTVNGRMIVEEGLLNGMRTVVQCPYHRADDN